MVAVWYCAINVLLPWPPACLRTACLRTACLRNACLRNACLRKAFR